MDQITFKLHDTFEKPTQGMLSYYDKFCIWPDWPYASLRRHFFSFLNVIFFFIVVVYKEPFAIEEDGFGNFQLQAELCFLDHLVSISYDITLFDQRELYAFRSARVDPGKSNWHKFVELGGVRFRLFWRHILRRANVNQYFLVDTKLSPMMCSLI